MKLVLSFVVALLALSQQALATNVNGLLTGVVTFTKANSPYIITGNTLLQQGATLNIEPGVEVRAEDWVVFDIDGSIRAVGTATDPIKITSNTLKRWSGLKVRNIGTADSIVFDYCHFELAATGLKVEEGYVSITNCVTSHCVTAFRLESTKDILLSENVVKYCYLGIYAKGKGLVSNNEVAHVDDWGIQTEWQVNIDGNYVHDCGKGIGIWGGATVSSEVANNAVVNVKGLGYSINMISTGGVHGNIAAYNGTGFSLVAANCTVEKNTIVHNEIGVVAGNPGAYFKFVNNCVDSNTKYDAMTIYGMQDVQLSGNYWGTIDSAKLEIKLFDFVDSFYFARGIITPALALGDLGCKAYTGPAVTKVQTLKAAAVTLTVLPNPFSDRFTIELQGKANKLEVFNMAGQRVYSADVTNKNKMEVDMSAYPAGVYHYRAALADNSIVSGKLVKQ